MAQLQFNANTVAPSTGVGDPVPAGWYNAAISASEMKPTQDGTGTYLALTFDILDGQFAGRKIFVNLNLRNANPMAQEIAYKDLSAICHATGVMQIQQDSSELHGRPMKVKVKIRPAKGEYEASNAISAYKNINEQVGGVGSPTGANPVVIPAGGAPIAIPQQQQQAQFQPAQQPWQQQPAHQPMQQMQQPMQQQQFVQQPAYQQAPQQQMQQPQYQQQPPVQQMQQAPVQQQMQQPAPTGQQQQPEWAQQQVQQQAQQPVQQQQQMQQAPAGQPYNPAGGQVPPWALPQ